MVKGLKYLLGVTSILLLTGCTTMNTAQQDMSYGVEDLGMAYTSEMMSADMAVSKIAPGIPAYNDTQQGDEHVIKTGNINFDTVKYNDDKAALFEVLEKHEAQINRQEEYTNGGQYTSYSTYTPYTPFAWETQLPEAEVREFKTLSLTVQVEQDKFNELAQDLERVAEVTYSSLSNDNVTDRVVDLEGRIDSIDAKIKRLEKLYEQANSMEDIINIQTELENAFSNKESLEGQYKNITQQVEYSTFYINLYEVEELKDLTQRRRTFREYLSEAVEQSGIAFVRSLENLAILTVYALPYLVVLAIFLVLVKVGTKSKKRKKAKKLDTSTEITNHGDEE